MLLLIIRFIGATAMYSNIIAMWPIAGDLNKGFSEHHRNVQVADVDIFAMLVRDDISERGAGDEAVMEAKFKADEEQEAKRAKAKAEPEPETKVEVEVVPEVEVESEPAEVVPEVKPEAEDEAEPRDATSTCLAMNSKQWLNATTGTSTTTTTDTSIGVVTDETRAETQQLYALRSHLVYLSIYYHQHRDALEEAITRKLARELAPEQCQQDMEKQDIGNFDYECPNGKFMVVSFHSAGLGSVMLRTFAHAMMVGLQTNRTVVFLNNVHVNGTEVYPMYTGGFTRQTTHDLKTTCARGDMQCFFQAPTACVLTEEDLLLAPTVDSDGVLKLPKERVLKVDLKRNKGSSRQLLQTLRDTATHLIDELDPSDSRVPLLRKAADMILDDTKDDTEFPMAKTPVVPLILLYGLRTQPHYAEALEAYTKNDIPDDFESSTSIGLPIRGSNKCNQESECLAFPNYMKFTKKMWQEEGFKSKTAGEDGGGKPTANILLTSEMESVLSDAARFMLNETLMADLPFTPRFITNTRDMSSIPDSSDLSPMMLATFASMKLHMSARRTAGNCCSNFHQLLFFMLRGGCGLHSFENAGMCLQRSNETEYKLVCDRRSYRQKVPIRDIKLAEERGIPGLTLNDLQIRDF